MVEITKQWIEAIALLATLQYEEIEPDKLKHTEGMISGIYGAFQGALQTKPGVQVVNNPGEIPFAIELVKLQLSKENQDFVDSYKWESA